MLIVYKRIVVKSIGCITTCCVFLQLIVKNKVLSFRDTVKCRYHWLAGHCKFSYPRIKQGAIYKIKIVLDEVTDF